MNLSIIAPFCWRHWLVHAMRVSNYKLQTIYSRNTLFTKQRDPMNRKIFQIASAYMSVIVGGGFASGQEVLQFFTNFGWMGVAGTVISGVLFAFLGMQIARIGT